MLVQALAEYADAYLPDQLAAEAWEEKPVPVLLEIGHDGSFLQKVERLRQENRGKKTVTLAQPLQVPRSPVPRNSGLHPLLAADDIKYVLGPGAWTVEKDVQNANERHTAFAGLIQSAAAATHDPALEACARFYSRGDQVEAAREALKESKPGVLIALSVDGPLVMRPAVRRFWNEHYSKAFAERVEAGGIGECIVSGKVGPIAPTHEKIKGMAGLGGQPAGVSLMSFDKPAFRSYGWEQNANSPVSPDRAMAYVLALNDLLRSDKGRRRDIAGTGFIYWTRKPVDYDPMEIAEQARPEQVAALLQFDPKAVNVVDPNMFYMAGVAGNGGRLLVRYWLAESLAQVKANLKGWFEGLRVVDSWGQVAPSPKLWQLRFAIDREGEPSAGKALELVRRALEGEAQPLGYDVLSAILTRLRHRPENKPQGGGIQIDRFAPARMGLLRLCLNDLSKGGREMTESLDQEQNHPAYLCGRLLAMYEDLQDTAYRLAGEREVNVTIGDRYFALASTSPGIAFPKIEERARSHFRKLRNNPKYPGLAHRIEQRVAALHEKVGGVFPSALGLEGQGRFALGYYHQIAEKGREIAERQQKKEEQEQTQ